MLQNIIWNNIIYIYEYINIYLNISVPLCKIQATQEKTSTKIKEGVSFCFYIHCKNVPSLFHTDTRLKRQTSWWPKWENKYVITASRSICWGVLIGWFEICVFMFSIPDYNRPAIILRITESVTRPNSETHMGDLRYSKLCYPPVRSSKT